MRTVSLVLAACFLGALAQDSFENTGVKLAFKIYEDCGEAAVFSSCLKRKAITFLDRLGRMEKFSLMEGVTIKRSKDAEVNTTTSEDVQKRSSSATDEDLNSMLMEKFSNLIGSRTVEISVPKLAVEEGEGGEFIFFLVIGLRNLVFNYLSN